MIDYVKSATQHYGTVFKTRTQGLSKIKVTDKDLKADTEQAMRAAAQQYSDDSNLIFLNNRMTHPNKVGGYRRTN